MLWTFHWHILYNVTILPTLLICLCGIYKLLIKELHLQIIFVFHHKTWRIKFKYDKNSKLNRICQNHKYSCSHTYGYSSCIHVCLPCSCMPCGDSRGRSSFQGWKLWMTVSYYMLGAEQGPLKSWPSLQPLNYTCL